MTTPTCVRTPQTQPLPARGLGWTGLPSWLWLLLAITTITLGWLFQAAYTAPTLAATL